MRKAAARGPFWAPRRAVRMDYAQPDLTTPTLLRPDPVERLLAPVRVASHNGERWKVAAIVAGLLLCHVGLLALFFEEYGVDPVAAPEQEIAVEVVPPPEQAPPPPPPEPPPPEQKQEAQKPPDLDMTPAQDSARKANKETVERPAPDQKTQAQTVAPPAEKGVEAKVQEKPADARTLDAPTPGPVLEKAADEKPDAEAIEHAERKPEDLKRFASPEPKAQNGANVPTIAQMMARLEPIPDYKIAGAAKEVPNANGTAKPNYLSILHGMIVPRFQRPPVRRSRGQIVIYIDTIGHVLHMGMISTSGVPELDAAAMAAVRRAAPFPSPPPGLPAVVWTFD